MNIPELIQQLDAQTVIELFEVDTTNIGGTDRFYFHAGTNAASAAVVWQTRVYAPWPVSAEGFDKTLKGAMPRPTFRVSNISRSIYPILDLYDDLIGARVVRRRTFARYLDASVTADPTQFLPDDIYYVERKVMANSDIVELELASALDLMGVKLPGRIITVNSCQSEYRGTECSYTGTNYFNVDNTAVGSLNLDVCSKTVVGCKVRFGAKARLPFGGFPAARTYKS